MAYLSWKKITINDSDDITSLYNEGFVFTRVSKGRMDQTRSVRIDLSKFELSSENKRILRKIEDTPFTPISPPYANYTWDIGKLAKDFYDTKFGKGVFSANKIKELLTENHNFNTLFIYGDNLGYAICFENDNILHYSYPFYSLETENKSLGMGMMVKAIEYAKTNGKKYIYLGSAQRPTDTYKLQFKGLEWFDGEKWIQDIDELKKTLKPINP